MIGNRYECQCCDRVATITDEYKDGYEYVFDHEMAIRWIPKRDASIRFRLIGDKMETVKEKLVLSIERIDYINQRLWRLKAKLKSLPPENKKQISSTRVAIQRWNRILATGE